MCLYLRGFVAGDSLQLKVIKGVLHLENTQQQHTTLVKYTTANHLKYSFLSESSQLRVHGAILWSVVSVGVDSDRSITVLYGVTVCLQKK